LHKYAQLVETYYELQRLSNKNFTPAIEKLETEPNMNFEFDFEQDGEIKEQLLGESDVESSSISAADPRLQELQEEFDELYTDLTNI
jgi:hypothetical protein